MRWWRLAKVMVTAIGWAVAAAPRSMAAETRADVLEEDAAQMLAIPRVSGGGVPGVGLDEWPWPQAACITGFVDVKGDRLAREATWVYVCHDESLLWLAYRCEVSRGDKPEAKITERDGPVWRDDSVEFDCDPAHSHRDYYHVVVNTAGIVYDAAGTDKSWNADVRCTVAVDQDGWTAVLGIPLAQLRHDDKPPPRVWPVDFRRNSSATGQSCWAPGARTFQAPRHFGHLVFEAQDVRPARLRKVDPVVIGANRIGLEARAGLGYRIEGVDESGSVILSEQGTVPADGVVPFFVGDDRARRVKLCLSDEKNRVLARGWYPLESPEVTARIRRLDERVGDVERLLPKFARGAAEKARGVLARLKDPLRDALDAVKERGRHTAPQWEQLGRFIGDAERELDAAWCYAQTRERFEQAGFAVGLASPMHKVMIRDFPFDGWFADHYDLGLARNEHEGFQVVVIPFHEDVKRVQVSVSPLGACGQEGASAQVLARVSLVGHVDVADNPPYEADYHGWWPDPLLSFQRHADVQAGEHVAFWIDLATSAATPAGEYEATVTVSAAGCEPIGIRLNVNVWDFEIPPESHLPTAFTYDEPGVSRIYGKSWTRELQYGYYDLVLEHRLGIDHLYRGTAPDLEAIQYAVKRGMRVFNIVCLGQRERSEERLGMVADYVPKLKAAGLFERAYVYGFDEVKEDLFGAVKEVFDEVHRRFPGLRTMTTAEDRSFGRHSGLGEAVDIWVPLTDRYDLQEAQRLRRQGKDMWWYVCVAPHHPYANWFIEYPAIEARLLMGAMSYKYQVGGVLYYLMTLWENNREPIRSGPYTSWDPGSFTNSRGQIANGDGSLLCPGPDGPLSTIRLENIRDGLEDYEYLHLLGQRVSRVRQMPATAEHEAFVRRAEQLLAVPPVVVGDLTEYTRDPRELYEFRSQVAAAVVEGGRLLERASSRPSSR